LLVNLLSFTLLWGPPDAAPRADEASEEASGDALGDGEFGELEPGPLPRPDPTDAASGGYGTLAPLPTYIDEPEAKPEREPAEPKAEGWRRSKSGFEEPEDYGPFFEPEPTSEVVFPGDAYRPDRRRPFASVGSFCFIEDSVCGASLIADADVGVGLNVITSSRGFDIPYTQFRVRGGVALRPLELAKQRWHPWGVGVVASWSLGSGSVTATNRDPTEALTDITETDPIRSWRVALLNQVWLSQRRNALHLDFTLGGINSTVLGSQGRYWGTHAEVAIGVGGWGGLYFAGDFLDSDTRVFMGLRGHGIATGPLIALVILGLVAGGAAL
jgi:hypothetical protein